MRHSDHCDNPRPYNPVLSCCPGEMEARDFVPKVDPFEASGRAETSPSELNVSASLVEAVRLAEDKAYSDWWGGGRTDVHDSLRMDEMNRRRRVAIVRAIVASFGWR